MHLHLYSSRLNASPDPVERRVALDEVVPGGRRGLMRGRLGLHENLGGDGRVGSPGRFAGGGFERERVPFEERKIKQHRPAKQHSITGKSAVPQEATRWERKGILVACLYL